MHVLRNFCLQKTLMLQSVRLYLEKVELIVIEDAVVVQVWYFEDSS